MHTKKPGTASEWVDPDDAPHLTREWFEPADLYHGDKMVRRGRPKSASPKEAVNLRLDAEVSPQDGPRLAEPHQRSIAQGSGALAGEPEERVTRATIVLTCL